MRSAFRLASPHTWPAAIMPSLFGVVYCFVRGLYLNPFQIIALILACMLMQSSVNTLNDYIDYKKGTDSEDDNVEESDAVLVYAGINPKSALVLGIAYLFAAFLLGVFACIFTGFMPLVIGLLGALTVAFYSAGPLPISYLPIGEIVSGFVMGGLIPLGCTALSDNKLHFDVLFWALPMIISIALIMMCNNTSDIEKDIKALRRTLPVCLGRQRSRSLFRAFLVLWIVLLCVFPVALVGPLGLLCAALLFIARNKFLFLLRADLMPEGRIALMKGITSANTIGNGAYILALIFGLCLGRLFV